MKNSPERWLAFLLRFAGGVCLLAVIPWFMPLGWIAGAHERVGLGTFPDAPIAEYLARFASALCAFYGGLLVFLSLDVHRYAAIIRYQAIAILVVSGSFLILGPRAGLPVLWAVADTVACLAYCAPTLWLQRKIRGIP